MPSRVRMLIRSASNSATIASTLNNSRPTGSVGSYTEPPRLSLTCLIVSSSAMARASGRDGLPGRDRHPACDQGDHGDAVRRRQDELGRWAEPYLFAGVPG